MKKARIFSHLIILLSFGWIIRVTVPEAASLVSRFEDMTPAYLLPCLALGAVAHLFDIYGFQALLCAQQQKRIGYPLTAQIWTGSQVARYLPGRIFGLVYQLALTDRLLNKTALVTTNLSFMFVNLIATVGLSGLIVLYYRGQEVAGLLLFLGALAAVQIVAPERFAVGGIRYLGRYIAVLRQHVEKLTIIDCAFDRTAVNKAFWGSVISLLVNIVSWVLLARIFPALAQENMVLLWGCYLLAWAIGVLSVITPAGLGIREGAFIAIGSGVAPLPVLVALSVVARFWHLLIDILIYVSIGLLLRRSAPAAGL